MQLGKFRSIDCTLLALTLLPIIYKLAAYLIGGITVLDYSIRTDDHGINVLMLEQATDHGITNHTRRDLQGRQL